MSRQNENFSLFGRLKSMGHALDGIRALLRGQHNASIHALATVTVLAAGFYFYVSSTEWIALMAATGAVAIGFIIFLPHVKPLLQLLPGI